MRTSIATAARLRHASLLVAGCRYSLNGGGLPTDIKSVAIVPFDNETASPELQQELNEALRKELCLEAWGSRRPAEDKASAVVRGKIVKYDLDVAIGVQRQSRAGDVVAPAIAGGGSRGDIRPDPQPIAARPWTSPPSATTPKAARRPDESRQWTRSSTTSFREAQSNW